MRGVSWFSALMTAPLQVMLDQVRADGIAVHLQNEPSVKTRDALCRNGFLCQFGLPSLRDSFHTNIRLVDLGSDVVGAGVVFLSKEVFKSQYFPSDMSVQQRRLLLTSFAEIFTNIKSHAETRLVSACGQYFVKDQLLGVIVSDGGESIPAQVRRFLSKPMTDVEAIRWALKRGNTTRKDRMGGDGLTNLRKFIASNGGSLTIASGHGYWRQEGDTERGQLLEHPFPGTSVSWVISTHATHTKGIVDSETDW